MAKDSVKSGFSFQFESTTPPEVQRNPLAGLDLSFTQQTQPSEQAPRTAQATSAAPVADGVEQNGALADTSQPQAKGSSSEESCPSAQQCHPLPTKASAQSFDEKELPQVSEQGSKVSSALLDPKKGSETLTAQPQAHHPSEPEVRTISFPEQKASPLTAKSSPENREQIENTEAPSLAAIEKLRRFKGSSKVTVKRGASQKTTLSPALEASRIKQSEQSEQSQHTTLSFGDTSAELSEPEDIHPQLCGEDYEAGGSDLDESLWESESIQPGAVLNKVKLSWNTATEQAGKWTQRGIRVGHHLSRDAVDALRQQRRNSHNKQEALASRHQEETLPKQAISARILRSGLGPLSALIACGLVYLGGNGLINYTGLLSSKTLIPELGSLAMTPEADATAPIEQRRAEMKSPIALSRYQKVSSTRKPPAQREAARPKRFAPPMPLPKEPPPMKVESAPMPEELSYPGKGLLEVVTSERELIYVDSVFVGRGPLRRIPLDPGEHEIRIQNSTSQRSGKIDVVATQRNRAVFAAF